MHKKIIFIVLCVVLAVIIAVAAAFYNKFSKEYDDNNPISVIEKSDDSETDKNHQQNNETSAEEFGTSQAENEEQTEHTEQYEQNDNIAPDVEFYDINGNSVMLSDFFDKPLVLNFWATWCGPCKSEMPGFNRLYEQYKDRVNFVLVNVSDSEKTVSDFLEENGYSFPSYFDKTQIASYTYGASSIPLTFIMYKGGEIYGYRMGVLPEEALEKALKTVLGEE